MIAKRKFREVSAVYWQDAAYSFRKTLPKETLSIEITIGVILAQNKHLINIATNLNFYSRENKFMAKDGFLIPKKTILKIKTIGYLDE